MTAPGTDPSPPAQAEVERTRRQRQRSYAIAGLLLGLVAIFYAVTIVQMGENAPPPPGATGTPADAAPTASAAPPSAGASREAPR